MNSTSIDYRLTPNNPKVPTTAWTRRVAQLSLATAIACGLAEQGLEGTAQAAPATVTIGTPTVGRITVGTGWSTWNHWWQADVNGVATPGRYRDTWNDAQWAAYLQALKDSGADWVRVDYFYGDSEPRDSHPDASVIDFSKFTMESAGLKTLKRMLSFFDANGIDAYLTFTYNRCNVAYNADKGTGWNSTNAVTSNFSTLWSHPTDAPVSKRKTARNMAATLKHLIVDDHHTSLKQVALYVEPNVQWHGVDGIVDTAFLGTLLTNLGIRHRVKIMANHTDTYFPIPLDPASHDFDIYAMEYGTGNVDFSQPHLGLQHQNPVYRALGSQLKQRNPEWEWVVAENGPSDMPAGTNNPLPAYLKNLADVANDFQLYNDGAAGINRWSFEPLYHPFTAWSVLRLEGVQYAPTAPLDNTPAHWATVGAAADAMHHGARVQKVTSNFEPMRLLMSNLHRGSTVFRSDVADPDGKGLMSVAAKDAAGKWHVGLINLYTGSKVVSVSFPAGAIPESLSWESYDASLPPASVRAVAPAASGDKVTVTLKGRSVNFLSGGASPPGPPSRLKAE